MLKRQQSFLNNNGKIYLVATPIGNFDDITYRAVEILKTVDCIYCEDTRNTSLLLSHYKIVNKLKSYHMFNENEITCELINRVKNGENIAIVSDAGMPCISDPGFVAAKMGAENGVDVVIIPGVSAGISALCASGITCNHYYFYGFLNSKTNARKKELNSLVSFENTLIFYEAPHRIKETLQDMLDIFGDRYIVLARELTKKFEEFLRGNISEVLQVVDSLKGEMVIIVSGATREELVKDLLSLSIKEHHAYYVSIGENPKDALKIVAKDRRISKSDVYQEIYGKNKEI